MTTTREKIGEEFGYHIGSFIQLTWVHSFNLFRSLRIPSLPL